MGLEKLPAEKQVSRREILKGLGLVAGAALIPNILKVVQQELGQSGDQIVIESKRKRENLQVVPEHERHLEKIIFNYWQGGQPLKLYKDLFDVLPQYTQIELLITARSTIQAKEDIHTNRAIHVRQVAGPDTLDNWMQDYAEIIKVNGKDVFLVPKNNATERVTRRNAIIKEAFGKDAVLETDFYFEGGNLTFDVIDGTLVVFSGYSDVVKNITAYEKEGIKITPKEVAEKMSEGFGGAKVIIMGNQTQSELLPHLDQSFVILVDHQVVMTAVPKGFKLYAQQQYQKQQLQQLGYTIREISHSRQDIFGSYFSVNAIPYIDKNTGEKKILFPVFPGEVSGQFEEGVCSQERLRGKAKEAYDIYVECGYIPIPIRDFANDGMGDLHCISYVMS